MLKGYATSEGLTTQKSSTPSEKYAFVVVLYFSSYFLSPFVNYQN